MRILVAACLLLLGRVVLAHDAPLNPSTCALDGLGFDAPAGGAQPVLAPPGAADSLRVVYGTATSTIQFQQRQPVPRPFTIAGAPGAIVLPPAFDAALDAAGDLRADRVTLEVSLAGGTVRMPLQLTTGLVARGGTIAGGMPVQPDGRFELVGAVPSGLLQPALAGVTGVRLGCRLQPVPDLGRFAPASAIDTLIGSLSARGGSLRGVLRGAPVLAALGAEPVLLEVRVNGGRAAVVTVPGGFAGSARRRVAEAPDGSRITLRSGGVRGSTRLQVRLAAADLPASLAGPVDVRVALVSGAVTARGAATFRARGGVVRAGS